RRVNRNTQLVRGAEQRFVLQSEHATAFEDVFAGAIVKLGGAHRLLEFRRADDFAKELIGFQKNVVLKKDVIDADDAFFTQHFVIEIVQAAPHFEPDAEMRVVIDIGASRNDPVDESRSH